MSTRRLILILAILAAVAYGLSVPIRSYLWIKAAEKTSSTAMQLIIDGTKSYEYSQMLTPETIQARNPVQESDFYIDAAAKLRGHSLGAEPNCRLDSEKTGASHAIIALCSLVLSSPTGKTVAGARLVRSSSAEDWTISDIMIQSKWEYIHSKPQSEQ